MKWSKRWITDKKWIKQYLGAAFKNKKISCCTMLAVACLVVLICALAVRITVLAKTGIVSRCNIPMLFTTFYLKKVWLLLSILLCIVTGYVAHVLNPIFSLRKQETRITWTQIVFLSSIGLLIVALVENVEIKEGSPESYAFAIAGALLGWIFQDTIKSVAAFFYLRINGLLKIDDWIVVPGHQIDGMVKKVSLTTVTVENWDTTTSAFPTYILHSEHFQNLQLMNDGKTHGRQMLKTFVIDTGWIHPLTADEVEEIRKHAAEATLPFIEAAVCEKKQNITAFREYIYQMLLTNPNVSHYPRLLVRWLEQRDEGMPLQLYCYITKTSLEPFEWEQSKIIEQVIEALPWFGLQLYQSASQFDASNSNIFLSKEPAKYRKDYGEAE